MSQVKMHGLNTPFSTTWFLAPYCAWLGYGMSSRLVAQRH
jgi:hypothetical protein